MSKCLVSDLALPSLRLSRGTPFEGDSLVEMLEQRAAAQGSETAYVFLHNGESPAASLTWGELAAASRTVASWLRDRVPPGGRALLVYPPGLEFIAGFFGCLYAKVLAVPVPAPLNGKSGGALERLHAIARDAQPGCALTSGDLLRHLSRDVRSATLETMAAGLPWLATDELRSMDAHGAGGASTAAELAMHRQDIAFLQYTSGSTARPKGVMVTHGNLLHNLTMAFHLGETNAQSVSVSWLPVTHDMGLIEGVLQPAFSGCPAYLMSPAAFLQRPMRWLQAISRYRATRSGGPNFAYDLAVRRVSDDDRRHLDLHSWRAAYNGAEPIRRETMREFAGAFGPCGFDARAFRPCYGLAEATLLVTSRQWDDTEPDGPVSCGVPQFGTRVRIVEAATGLPCDDGAIGEIQVQGEGVTAGYWQRPDETAATFVTCGQPAARWLRTGDLGFVRHAHLFVTGRLKDLLIVRGAKHFPQDLERTAEACESRLRPGSVAAITIGHGVRGDRVALVAELGVRGVETADGERIVSDVRQAIAEAHGIQLSGVALVTPGSVPRTTSGKLQRFLCRDAWLHGRLDPLVLWQEPMVSAG